MDEGEPSAVASALYELAVWRQTRPTFSILVVEARTPERRAWMPRVTTGGEDDEDDEDDYVEPVPRVRPRGGSTRGDYPVERGARARASDDDPFYEDRGYPDEPAYAEQAMPLERYQAYHEEKRECANPHVWPPASCSWPAMPTRRTPRSSGP